MTASNNLQVPKGREVEKARMMRLDVDVSCDLLECAENLQLIRIHFGISGSKGEVLINLLEPIEGGVKNSEAALEDGAVAEVFNVSRVNRVGELTNLWTRAVTGNTFTIISLKIIQCYNY